MLGLSPLNAARPELFVSPSLFLIHFLPLFSPRMCLGGIESAKLLKALENKGIRKYRLYIANAEQTEYGPYLLSYLK